MMTDKSIIISLLTLLLLVPASSGVVFAAKSDSDGGGSSGNEGGDTKSDDSSSKGTSTNDDNGSKNKNDGGKSKKNDNKVSPVGGPAGGVGSDHGGIDDTLQDNADDELGDVMRDGTRIKDGQVVGHVPRTCGVNSSQPGCGPDSDPNKLPGSGKITCLKSASPDCKGLIGGETQKEFCKRNPDSNVCGGDNPPTICGPHNHFCDDFKPKPIVIHIDKTVNKHTNNIVNVVQMNTAIAINGTPFPLTDFHFFTDGTFLPICGTVEDKLIGGNCWDNTKREIVKA